MTNEFSHLNLHPKLVQVTAELGFSTPTDVQAQVIPLMLDGKDIIAQSQTGSGKTAAFGFPILQNLIDDSKRGNVQTLVLTPTRELAIQVADAISQYGRYLQVEVMPVYGGQHYGTSKRRIKNGVDVIVGTPGRLQDLMRQNILDLGQVRTVILDEADEMLSMGFIEDIENILRETPAKRQTTLFSATIPKPIRRLADRYMIEPQIITIKGKQITVATIEQRYYLVNEKDKLAALTRLFEVEDVGAQFRSPYRP
jgi:ATP-dependent RNA helicase DeaD